MAEVSTPPGPALPRPSAGPPRRRNAPDHLRGRALRVRRWRLCGDQYRGCGLSGWVSTKTLYRLILTQPLLFDGMVTDRLDRTLASVDSTRRIMPKSKKRFMRR